MGVVIPFKPRAKQTANGVSATLAHGPSVAEQAVLAAMDDGADRQAILDAAGPLIEHCRDHYGFTVMRDGLPSEPDELGAALLTLMRGLSQLEAEFGGRPFWSFGVYFGHQKLTWFEDGYGGKNALAVPSYVPDTELAAFVRPRVQALRS